MTRSLPPTQPVLTVTTPALTTITVSESTIRVAGTATDVNANLNRLEWSSDRLPAGGSLPAANGATWPFQLDIPLVSGLNTITLRLFDATGYAISQDLLITYTAPGPVVEPPTNAVTTPAGTPSYTSAGFFTSLRGTAEGARLDGAAARRGVTQVSWSNNRGGSGLATLAPSTTPGAIDWIASVIPVHAGANVITITVTDDSGRSSSSTVDVAVAQPTYYLAEGAVNDFFKLDILIANPNQTPAPIRVQFLGDRGPLDAFEQTFTVGAESRHTLTVNDIPGIGVRSIATVVTSTAGLPLIVERTMEWDKTQRYGSATDHAVDGLARTWYFAEGAQNDFFKTYLLLSNPVASANRARIRYLRADAPDVTRTVPLPAYSRETLDLSLNADLISQTFGIEVTFDAPAVAERAMYFGGGFVGGHESAGVNQPSRTWFLAEGATGFFQTYVLLANPSPQDATIDLDFLLPNRGGIVRHPGVRLAAGQRGSVEIAAVSPRLAATEVSTRVTSNVPIVVERAQYWPTGAWAEAHNSFGMTEPGQRWGLAEGRVGGPTGYSTYILLANPGDQDARVTARFLRDRPDRPAFTKTYIVPANGRFTIFGNEPVPELANETFGAVIESNQPIVVERAMYSNALGQHWQAGSNATATRLPASVP